MGIKKCDAKYTKPFVGKTNVIVMMAVEGGESTASATQLDYDMVHALEKTIVDCTFIDDEPQIDWKDEMWTEAVEDEPQGCIYDRLRDYEYDLALDRLEGSDL